MPSTVVSRGQVSNKPRHEQAFVTVGFGAGSDHVFASPLEQRAHGVDPGRAARWVAALARLEAGVGRVTHSTAQRS
jgi:hypothetical protein